MFWHRDRAIDRCRLEIDIRLRASFTDRCQGTVGQISIRACAPRLSQGTSDETQAAGRAAQTRGINTATEPHIPRSEVVLLVYRSPLP